MMNKAKLLAVLENIQACEDSIKFVRCHDNLFALYKDASEFRPDWLSWLGVRLQPELYDVLRSSLMAMMDEESQAYWEEQHFYKSDYTGEAIIYEMVRSQWCSTSQIVIALIKRHLPVRRLLRLVEAYYEERCSER